MLRWSAGLIAAGLAVTTVARADAHASSYGMQQGSVASADVSRPAIPSDLLGAWELKVDAKQYKLKDSYSIEMKFADGSDGLPEALVAYFTGDPRRPSGLCRSQLDLVSSTPDILIFDETLNYKSNRSVRCPIWGKVSIGRTSDGFVLQWAGTGSRKQKIRMAANATRLNGGQECRMVGATSSSGGEVWCRDAEGNWSAKRT